MYFLHTLINTPQVYQIVSMVENLFNSNSLVQK
jgi:hypothetical protein